MISKNDRPITLGGDIVNRGDINTTRIPELGESNQRRFLTREQRANLRTMCDKNTVWPKLKLAVRIWGNCISRERVDESQVKKFEEMLLGFLVVEHDNGDIIKVFKEMERGGTVQYTLLRSALDFSGIGKGEMNDDISRMVIFPNGTIKVEYRDKLKDDEWFLA